jgi:hypothetical protein
VRREAILLIAIAGIAPHTAAAQAQPDAAKAELVRQIEPHLPSNWSFRATWRDAKLVGYVSPTTQEAFDLLYEPERQKQVLSDLCEKLTPAVWELVGADASIALEPVIGGKSADVRLDCKRPGRA